MNVFDEIDAGTAAAEPPSGNVFDSIPTGKQNVFDSIPENGNVFDTLPIDTPTIPITAEKIPRTNEELSALNFERQTEIRKTFPGYSGMGKESFPAGKPIFKIVPELTPEEQESLKKATPEEQRKAGYAQGTAQAINSLTTPENITLLAATAGFGGVPVVGRAIALAFAASMAKQAPEIASELGTEFAKPKGQRDEQKIGQLIAQGGATTGFTVLAGLHGTKPGEPGKISVETEAEAGARAKLISDINQVAPLTAAEVAKGGSDASTIGSAAQAAGSEVRTRVDESTPLRQSGETTGAGAPETADAAQAAQGGGTETLGKAARLEELRAITNRTPEQEAEFQSLKAEDKTAQKSAAEVFRESMRQAQQPVSVGPGGLTPGDLPPEPPISATPEHQRPNGIVTPTTPILHSIGQALLNIPTKVGELGHSVRMAIRGIAGKTLPRITDANREVGEAGARYGSSRIAARPMARTFSTTTLQGTGVDPVKLGAALTEDNLRSVREGYRGRATELLADGDAEGAAKATEAADKVASIVGGKNSPFQTEEAYQEFLNDPATKQAINQHIQQWQETIEPQFKTAQGLDPDVELPTRGQQTGARINLKALQEGDTPVAAAEAMASAPRLTGTMKRKTPFGIKAKGTGIKYETDYNEIIANTFEKQLEISNKNAFDNALVEKGLAEIHRPGWTGTIDGQRPVSFPLKRGTRAIKTADGETLTANQAANIYVRGDLAGEYRTVSNVDPRLKIPMVTGLMNVINRIQLAGLTDFTVHTSNLMTALFNNPTTGKLLSDSLLSATGRADIPVTLTKTILKAFQDNTKQIAELAEIGALRTDVPHGNWSGRILQAIDKTTRLVLDDTFKRLSDEGLVKNTETNRREFVNQVGQYNKRLQPRLMGLLRDSGVSPFITAGRTFTAMGVRQIAFKPGAEATGGMAATALRMNMLSKWVGATVLIGTANYLLTKDKDGGVLGRPGNPIGRLDFGIDDATGRPLGLPLLDIIGLGRGLRVTGIKGFSDSLRYGLPLQTALDAAGRDIINSQISPIAGPAVRTSMTAAVGQAPGIGLPRTAPVAPPQQNQLAVNVTAAVRDANPVVASVLDKVEGKTTSEAMQRQLTRFTLQPGKPPEMMEDYPRIVSMAQGKAYVDDVIRRARPMPIERREKFVQEAIEKMPEEDQKHAWDEIKRRKVFR